MQNSKFNYLLIERFAELEKLCNGIYNTKHGVTSYIEHMEKLGLISAQYKKLKDVRHKRNKLSHGEVPFDVSWATEEDITFITEFKSSVMNQTDPISIYIKREKQRILDRRNASRKDRFPQTQTTSPASYYNKPNNMGLALGCLFWILLTLLFFVVVYICID